MTEGPVGGAVGQVTGQKEQETDSEGSEKWRSSLGQESIATEVTSARDYTKHRLSQALIMKPLHTQKTLLLKPLFTLVRHYAQVLDMEVSLSFTTDNTLIRILSLLCLAVRSVLPLP